MTCSVWRKLTGSELKSLNYIRGVNHTPDSRFVATTSCLQ
jgi:hypothetical protein